MISVTIGEYILREIEREVIKQKKKNKEILRLLRLK